MNVESVLDDVPVTGLPIRNIWIEIDVGVDLEAFELGSITDRLLATAFLFFLPVFVGFRNGRHSGR